MNDKELEMVSLKIRRENDGRIVSACFILNTLYIQSRSDVVEPLGKHALSFTHVQLFAASWTVAHQASLSTRLSRQAYWNGLPFPSPGDLPDPGIEPRSHALQTDTVTSCATREAQGDTLNYLPHNLLITKREDVY